ncbi:MAG: hypothetical protein COV72_03900 [Candidatus Omnitrophica bacterium CG11_big_fil_rev_8_21_14_0_20_42_13]|uniref:Uncharacterized protein n=1 Tax=Candidatus Ghiorseimicrobium undicola TaxID=1974746 RepID=A0A2H0LXW8_9BACT|nr:MAG: hypothetical protein COV72_03900 [Candidatus Omnitrophica bacterium CG11_big_fil_rev_8_21_14_0_20_42_13]
MIRFHYIYIKTKAPSRLWTPLSTVLTLYHHITYLSSLKKIPSTEKFYSSRKGFFVLVTCSKPIDNAYVIHRFPVFAPRKYARHQIKPANWRLGFI